MTAATSNVEAKAARHASRFLLLTIATLLPALGYFVISMLVLFSGNFRPMRWLGEWLFTLTGAWSVPILLLLTVGGPTLSVLGSLILGEQSRFGYLLGGVCGGIAVALIVLNTLRVMFFLPFAFED